MARRLFFAVLILLLLLTPAYAYLGLRLAGTETLLWIVLLVPCLNLLVLPLMWWVRARARPLPGATALTLGAYVAMAVLTYLLLSSLVRDLAELAGFATPSWFAWSLSFTLIAAGVWRALRGPQVFHVDINGAPIALKGLRIVQISDLHVGPTIGRAYVERVVRLTREQKPDLVVLTGDIGDGDPEELKDSLAPMAELPRPMFYVPGNHEYYHGLAGWIDTLQALGARVLLNDAETLSHNGVRVAMAGIPDPAAASFPGAAQPDVKQAARRAAGADYRVLLSHRPGYARAAAQAGFHLQLSGHTHGGQFFPWNLVTARVHDFHTGLDTCGELQIYVNQGTGSWGPPVRLGTTPELTVLTLRP